MIPLNKQMKHKNAVLTKRGVFKSCYFILVDISPEIFMWKKLIWASEVIPTSHQNLSLLSQAPLPTGIMDD